VTASSARRLSPLRVLVVLVIVAGLVALGYVGWQRADRAVESITAGPSGTWFAPYTDVTLQPTYAFEDPDTGPAPTTVLGFVVPDGRRPCTPTWGTQYDLDGAASELDLDRRIARVRERGGDAIISFGGVANSELAVVCRNQASLTDAYRSVVDRYQASTIDLDIEGAALDDAAANMRRATAIRALQKEAPSDRPLQVWLTLPVTPKGLLSNGVGRVEEMLREGVDLAGVNLMTMDFGASKPDDMSMGDAARSALRAAHAQLAAAYLRAGRRLSAEQVWARLGVTPMIGRNDVQGEVFSLQDAASLAGFADEVGLDRVSVWSANRDAQCGPQDRGDWQVLPTCSGVEQDPLEFTRTFLGPLDGSPQVRTPPPEGLTQADGRAGDDPQASPYPIWRRGRVYMQGEKVVWQRTVYEAKWWTDEDPPDRRVANEWDTPWRTVGPVLPGDATDRTAADAAGPPRWSADAVYLRDDRVRHDGFLYEAKWRTQAEEPQLDPDLPDASAWTVVGRAVEDLPPVFEPYPEWQPATSYASRDRVNLGAYVYEAERANVGVQPEPAPSQPERAAWKVVGRAAGLSVPQGRTAG
jgi:chitinase